VLLGQGHESICLWLAVVVQALLLQQEQAQEQAVLVVVATEALDQPWAA
tara:strand:- start:35 stop:181 length:147 start_codon:yes stop_codon:yes gene_type:complete